MALETLPGLVGIALIVYVVVTIHRMGSRFFQVARSWALALSVAALAILWITEILDDSLGGAFVEINSAVGVWFVVFTIWLSTAMVSLVAVYAKYNLTRDFRAWVRANPFNFITVWGAVGLVIIVAWTIERARTGGSWTDNGWVLYAVFGYLLASVVADISMPIYATRKRTLGRLTREGRVSIALLAISWIGIPTVEFTLDVLPEMGMGYEGVNPYSWGMVVLFAVLASSIRRTTFLGLIVSPELETFKRDGFRSYDIPRGVYLVYGEKPDQAFGIVSELVSLPLRPDAKIPDEGGSAKATLDFLIPRGLVVTRESPEKLRQRHGFQTTPVVWLTESPGERRVAPTSLAILADTLVRFMEKNPNSIVLLEGVEYLATYNGFRKVLRQLDYLSETTWIAKARLLIAVNPKAFEAKDLALLERDRTVVDGAAGIEELKRESMVSAPFQ